MDSKKRLIFLGLWGATFMVQFGETIPQSFQPLFFEQLGISAALIGLVYNIRNIEQSVLRLVAGSLSDVFGRKRLILIGLILIAIVPFIYAVSWNAWLPLVAMFVSGLGVSIFFPPTESYASSLYPPHQVGTAMGRYHMSWAISAVIGPSVGGFLALYFPEFRQIFVMAGVVSMAAVVVFMLLTRGDHEKRSGEKISGQTSKLFHEFPSTMRRLFGNKSVVAGSAAVFVHAFCHWMLPTFIPIYAAGRLGFNTVDIGLALTANALMTAVALPIVGTVSDRIGRFLPIVMGLLASVAAFALLPHVQSPLMLIAIMATLGFCAVLEFPISQAIVMESLPLADRGSATGVWGMMMSLGGTIGMFVIAAIVSVAPIEWIFYFCAAFSLAAGLAMVAIRGYFKAQT
jgi:DHA1 family multidrug resistance protein-like MFS transporter